MGLVTDTYLNELISEKKAVDVFLTSGIKLSGYLMGFDHYVVMMGGRSMQMIYKHAISTIYPQNEATRL